MQTSKIAFRIVTLLLAATLITACSKESRKARLLGEADKYFKAGNYDKAKLSYLNVVRLDPGNALAFERIGAMWQDDGAPLRAVAFLIKASELDPKNAQNRIRLARCYLTIGRFADAKNEALKVLEQLPDNGDAIIALAEAARSNEDIEAAWEQLQKFPQKNGASFHLALANLFLYKADLAGAGDALRQTLNVDPKSAAAHMAMGDLYLLQKDPKKAGEEFKKAADLAPVRSMERLKYAAFKSATGDLEEVRRICTEMTRQAPDYLPGWVLLAELAFKDKKYDEALSLLENAFGRDPEYVDGRRLQSDVFLAKGDRKKALEVLERLDQTQPGTPLIKYQLGRAYLENNNMNQAKAALDQAISISPNYTDAILLLAQINLHSGHGEMVIEPLTNLLKKNPDMRSAAFVLAAAYGSLDRFDDAAVVIGEQARLAPQDPQPQMALGLTFRKAKRNDDARKAFEKAAELAPDNLEPINELVGMDLEEKRYAAAMQRVQQKFQKKPDSPMVPFMEARIYAAQHDWAHAESAAQHAIQLDANFTRAYDLLIAVYLAANKLPQAISQLEAELVKDPNNRQALLTMALVYEKLKDYPKARDTYEKLLALNLNSVVGLNNLAALYSERLNQLDRAYELAQKARTLAPGDGSIADTLGWILYKRGDYQQALTLLQESASKLPEEPEVQLHLGMAAYVMGQTDLAKVALRRAAGSAKDFEGKDESKRRLALLDSGKGASPELSVLQLEAMTKEQPNDVLAQMRLGEAYEKQGESDKAAAAFEQAFKINPKLTAAVTRLAQLYAGPVQNKEKALAYAKKARELAPADPQVAGILGKIAYESGNFTWSYSLLQEAVRQSPNDPSILHDLAWAAYSLGKASEARDMMQKALTTGPDSSLGSDAKKFLMFTALDGSPKEPLAAESEVQKELKSNPEFVPALMAQAAIQLQRNDTKTATRIYLQVLSQYPDFAPAQKRLAAIYAADPGDLAKAYDLAMKARKTLSDDPELARTLAEVNFKRKEFAYAIQLFQQTAASQPLPPKDLYYLGMAQLQTKQDAKGRETLERALAAGLQDPLAQEARQRLAELQSN
jgi:tetratricopeptide (TPR) repeat protein